MVRHPPVVVLDELVDAKEDLTYLSLSMKLSIALKNSALASSVAPSDAPVVRPLPQVAVRRTSIWGRDLSRIS